MRKVSVQIIGEKEPRTFGDPSVAEYVPETDVFEIKYQGTIGDSTIRFPMRNVACIEIKVLPNLDE